MRPIDASCWGGFVGRFLRCNDTFAIVPARGSPTLFVINNPPIDLRPGHGRPPRITAPRVGPLHLNFDGSFAAFIRNAGRGGPVPFASTEVAPPPQCCWVPEGPDIS